jgi:4-hydroxy-tetrahydrodipicolinate reductase
VYFLGDGERVELTHRVASRSVFADGAVRAARWLAGLKRAGGKPGMYSMKDVLAQAE